MTPPEMDEDDSTYVGGEGNGLLAWIIGSLVLAFALFSAWAIVALDTKDEQTIDAERRYEQIRNEPIPTVTQTVKVTLPPKTLPPKTVEVTIRVTERASRNVARSSPKVATSSGSSKKLDLRWSKLWDKIAACESGQRWSLNTGSYDGGLQFLPSTWRSWGGTDFAPYAYQATRAEQITVANRSGKTNPWLKPWPHCGRVAAAELGMAFP